MPTGRHGQSDSESPRRRNSQTPLRHGPHALGVGSSPPTFYGRRTTEDRCTQGREGTQMGDTLDEGMLIRHMDVRRTAKPSVDSPARLAILVEHMDGTEYTVSVADKRETPEHLTALLAAVARGANMMFRALDILRTIGYVDTRPVALLGRQIIFGLNRVALELEIIENRDGEIECDISVAGVNVENVEEIGGVLEENGIDLI